MEIKVARVLLGSLGQNPSSFDQLSSAVVHVAGDEGVVVGRGRRNRTFASTFTPNLPFV